MASQQQNSQERQHFLTESQLRSIAVESTQHLGYPTLKDEQLEAIVNFAQGKDCFVALPTGYGKSVIYGVLPYVFDAIKGIIIIVMVTMLHNIIIKINKQLWFVVKGTSVCAGITESIVLCVSPLTSLMLDQHLKFVPHGL